MLQRTQGCKTKLLTEPGLSKFSKILHEVNLICGNYRIREKIHKSIYSLHTPAFEHFYNQKERMIRMLNIDLYFM